MKICIKKIASVLLLVLLVFAIQPAIVRATCDEYECKKDEQSEDDYLHCIKDKQACLENKISETQTQAVTLSNTISIINGQIQVQQLQIDQTIAEIEKLERQIEELTTRISGLEISLDRMTTLLLERVSANYKRGLKNPFLMLITADSFGEFVSEYKYLQIAQKHISGVMQKAEAQRLDYDQQKALKEEKQTEVEAKRITLESQKASLDQQKAEQQHLLAETKNNEARYQSELAATLAELQAIQSIIAGRGDETKVGHVSGGDKIASIIAGASTCSTGTHLHFEVVKDGTHRNPAEKLKSVDISWDNSPDGPFGFSGDWDWPVNDPARITQGYGQTYYARVKRYYGGAPHTGIDMLSKTSGQYTVKAVRSGTLYRGSIPCGGGNLRYVKLEHDEDGYETYYLHVNY